MGVAKINGIAVTSLSKINGISIGSISKYNGQTLDLTDYLLDTYTGAKLAYSLRTIKASATNVVRVRRSSDNAESDFTPTQLTDGTLTTWTGANDGFVRTWYDQSGNGNHIGQATAGSQPKIVSAGTYLGRIDFTNGKTLTLGTGVDVFGTNSKMCWFEVTNYNLASTASAGTMHTWGTISACTFYHFVGTGIYFYNPAVFNQSINSFFENNSTEIYHYSTNAGGTDNDAVTQRIRSYKNNASAGTSFNNNKDHWSTELFLSLGGTMNAAHTVSRQEWIVFDDDKTDFADIISSINTHYATH